ncbi:MAG: hypothetical protein ACYTXY_52865, partial [Nostoc sp.]
AYQCSGDNDDKNLDPAIANALASLVKAAYRYLSQNDRELKQDPKDMSLIQSLSPEFRQRCEAIARSGLYTTPVMHLHDMNQI